MGAGRRLAALTNDLSMFGCSVKTETPFPEGTSVRLRIWHSGVNFVARGKVAYSRRGLGMGIVFTTIEPSSLSVLDGWLTSLRKQ